MYTLEQDNFLLLEELQYLCSVSSLVDHKEQGVRVGHIAIIFFLLARYGVGGRWLGVGRWYTG